MNETTKKLLRLITGGKADFGGAYSIRENGKCADMRSSENIKIEKKTDKPGLDIRIRPGTKGETLAIPACVTHGGVDDLSITTFYIGEGADVVIVAGCGVHTEHGEPARHNGIHRFFLARGAHVKYVEKHIGTGGDGIRSIDPVTEAGTGKRRCSRNGYGADRGVDARSARPRPPLKRAQSCSSANVS